MPIEIELPGGEIAEFPDDMSDDDIEAALRNEFSDIKIDQAPEFRGSNAGQLPDLQATTRGGPPVSLPDARVAMAGMAEIPSEAFESAGDAVAYAGNVIRSVPADVSAGMSLFRRPEGQKTTWLPSPTNIKEAVQKNLPYAAQASGNIPAAVMGEPRAELPIDLQLADAAGEGPSGMAAATLGRVSQDVAATAPLLAIGLLPKAAQQVAALGFSIHMVTAAPELFSEYAEEINKPEEEQDKDKISRLQSGIAQTFGFAPLAAKHGFSGAAREFSRGFEQANRTAPGPRTGGPRASDVGPEPPLRMPMQIEKGGERNEIEDAAKAAESERARNQAEPAREQAGVSDRLEEGREQESRVLNDEEIARLEAMDEQSRAPVEPERVTEADRMIDDAIDREGIGERVEFVLPDDIAAGGDKHPMAGRIARFNDETGKIEINRQEMAENLALVAPEKQAELAQTLIAHENVHSHTPRHDALAFVEEAFGIERDIATRFYLGKKGSAARTLLEQKLKDNPELLGWEMIRIRLQRLQGMTPDEILVQKPWTRERWTLKSLDMMARAIAEARRFSGTESSKHQQAILKNVADKIDLARNAIKEGGATAGAGGQAFDRNEGYYRRLLENPELVAKGVEVADLLAIPLGGKRKAGTLGVDFTKEDATQAAYDLAKHDPEGFNRARVKANRDENGNVTGYDVVWGEGLEKFPTQVSTGRALGYKESEIKSHVEKHGGTWGEKPAAMTKAAEERIRKLREQRLAEIRKSEVQEQPIEDVTARIIELSRKSREKPLTEFEMDEMRDLRKERDRRESQEFPAAPDRTEDKPKIAKMGQGGGMVGDRKNSFGDPANTTYHATPEDWAAWQKVDPASFENWGQREVIKNKYGGMPPEPPTEMPAAPSRTPYTAQKEAIEKHLDKVRPDWRDEFGMDWSESPTEIRGYFNKLAEIERREQKEFGEGTIAETHSYDENKQQWVKMPGADKIEWQSKVRDLIKKGYSEEEATEIASSIFGGKFRDTSEEQSFPAAMSKKDVKRQEELRKYQEAMGKRPETKRTTGLGEAVAPEERVGTTEFGQPPEQMPRTAADFDLKADEILSGPIKPRKQTAELMGEKTYQKWKRRQMILGEKGSDLEMRAQFSEMKSLRGQFQRPHFREFAQWAKRHVNLEAHQLRDMWEDSVWSSLIDATPERLGEWRSALGLEPKYGKSDIAPKRGPEAFQLATEGNKIVAKQNRAQVEASERYRNKVISAIAQKLIGESITERAELTRKAITNDDIDFSATKSKHGPYVEISADDLANERGFKAILRDQARASNKDPESHSRRLIAVVNRKTGEVEVLSTYNDAGVQRVTDPAGSRMTGKPSRELNKGFLSQYRPFASILLRDPVKAFRQKFESVSDYNDKIGKEAHERSAVGEFMGEGPAGEMTIEGTPGLQGEGGMFQGPHRTTMRRGTLESPMRLTRPEVQGVLDHIWSEVGELSSPNDVKLALLGLLDKSARGRMKAQDYLAQSAYRKMINTLQRQFPDRTREDVLNVMADRIYENNKTSETLEEYQRKTVADFKGQDIGDAGQPSPPSQTGRELTSELRSAVREQPAIDRRDPRRYRGPIERVPPTTVRPEQLPSYAPEIERTPPPKAELGSETPVRPGVFNTEAMESGWQAKQEASLHAVKERLVSEAWAEAYGEIEANPQARINRSRMKVIRDRIRRQQGVRITAEEAKAILEGKRGRTQPMDMSNRGIFQRAERALGDPLRTEQPAAPSRLRDFFKSAPRGPREAINPDVESPIPRLIPNVNTALTRAMGIERIPLIGRLWGERAKIRDDADRTIVGYGMKRAIGNSQAAITGAKLNAQVEQLGTPFEQMTDGKMMNVNAKPGQSLYPSDLFEDWQRQVVIPEKMQASRRFEDSEIAEYSEKHPITFSLSKGQEAQFREYLTLLEDGHKYLDEKNAKMETYGGESKDTRRRQQHLYGIPKGLEVYAMPRVALYKREIGPVRTEIRKRIGGQYAIEKERLYKTEDVGQRTTAYEPDMNKRMVTFIQRVYKAVADADMANDPALKGELKGSDARLAELAKEYEMEMRLPIGDPNRMTQKDVIDLSYQTRLGVEGEVGSHPAFSGKVYPLEIANKLNKAFGEQSQRYVRTASELSTASKAFMLTGDLAQYLQQGSVLMAHKPGIWGRATTKSLKSLTDPNVVGRYLNNPENWKAATEFVQSGGSLGHLQDFMSGAGPGELATKIPGFRQVVIRSGRAFGTFQDLAKIEMWKAMKETTPREQWGEVVERIEDLGISGKMESGGMSHARAIGERIILMAPAYYRGAMNLVAAAAEGAVGRGGVSSRMQTKALARYAGAWTLMMTSAYLAAGMSWEEIRHRLTPGQNNQKFLKFPVKIGGETVEIGPGGIVLSLLDLGTDMAVTTVTDPKKMVSLGTDNPLIKWLTARLGPLPTMARKLATGTDVFDRPVGPVEAVASAVLPIPLQKGISAAQGIKIPDKLNAEEIKESLTPGAGAVSAAASFIGTAAKRYRASNEVYELAKKFTEKEGLKRDSGFDLVQNDEPSYTKLRAAVAANSQRQFNNLYKELTENRDRKDLIKQMREWKNGPFAGSKKNEAAFRSSLSDYQYGVYLEAKEERERTYDKFLDMMSETP